MQRRIFGQIALYVLVLVCFLNGCAKDVSERAIELTTVDVSQASEAVQKKIQEQQEKIESNPSDPLLIGQLGILFELHGFSDHAMTSYELASELDSTEGQWVYYQAILLAARYDLEEANRRIDKAIALNPTYGPMWLYKGRMQLDNGQFEEALSSFEQAAQLSDDPYTLIGQAMAHHALGQAEPGLELLEELGELKTHPNVQRLAASLLILNNQREEAINILADIPEIAPSIQMDDPIAQRKSEFVVENMSDLLAQATALIREGKLDSALQMLSRLLEVHPNNKHVLQLVSDAYERQGSYEQALLTLQIAIEHNPNFYPLRTSIARIYRNQGKFELAIEHLDKAIEIEPTLTWAYTHKAQILMSQRKWLETTEVLDRAISYDQEDPDLYAHLGIAMGFLNRWPEARNLFKLAISVDDSHLPSYLNLVRAHTILGEEEEALVAITLAEANGASESQLVTLAEQRSQIKQMEIEVKQR